MALEAVQILRFPGRAVALVTAETAELGERMGEMHRLDAPPDPGRPPMKSAKVPRGQDLRTRRDVCDGVAAPLAIAGVLCELGDQVMVLISRAERFAAFPSIGVGHLAGDCAANRLDHVGEQVQAVSKPEPGVP
jgi:hypothetical protein